MTSEASSSRASPTWRGTGCYTSWWCGKATRGGVLLGDPAGGLERLDRDAFETVWVQNAVLLIAPGPQLTRDDPTSWWRWVVRRISGSSDWLIQAFILSLCLDNCLGADR